MTKMVLPLTVRDMTERDLPGCAWAGDAALLENMALQLGRAQSGTVDYLAVCPPSDVPIAVGGIDYAATPGAAVIWQLAVLAQLRSCGIGTLLIESAHERIRRHGLHLAQLSVEEKNPRARALYERLGYVAFGQKADAWETDQGWYETTLILMRRHLEI